MTHETRRSQHCDLKCSTSEWTCSRLFVVRVPNVRIWRTACFHTMSADLRIGQYLFSIRSCKRHIRVMKHDRGEKQYASVQHLPCHRNWWASSPASANNNNTFAHKVKCFGKLRKQFYLWHFMWQPNILRSDDEALAIVGGILKRDVSQLLFGMCRCKPTSEMRVANGERENGDSRLSLFRVGMNCIAVVIYDWESLATGAFVTAPRKKQNSYDLPLNCWCRRSVYEHARVND